MGIACVVKILWNLKYQPNRLFQMSWQSLWHLWFWCLPHTLMLTGYTKGQISKPITCLAIHNWSPKWVTLLWGNMSQSSFPDWNTKTYLLRTLKGPAHHHARFCWFKNIVQLWVTQSQSMESCKAESGPSASPAVSRQGLSRNKKEEQVHIEMLETARWCAAEITVNWRLGYKKKEYRNTNTEFIYKDTKNTEVNITYLEKRKSLHAIGDSLLNPLRQLTAFCLQTGGRKLSTPGPSFLGRRAWGHCFTGWGALSRAVSGKARWKGPDVCRDRGAGSSKQELLWLLGRVSVGGQKSCHLQIIKKNKSLELK